LVVGISNAENRYVRHNFSFSSIYNKANLAQQQKPIPQTTPELKELKGKSSPNKVIAI
jgi:hypothetical protein